MKNKNRVKPCHLRKHEIQSLPNELKMASSNEFLKQSGFCKLKSNTRQCSLCSCPESVPNNIPYLTVI